MILLYNGQLVHEEELLFPLSNRAFQYNDGFFETVIIQNGILRFWQDHKERIQEAAKALKLQLPQQILAPAFEDELLKLAGLNAATAYGRLKLKVWRSGAGLYTPVSNAVEWLVTVQPATPPDIKSIAVSVCQNVRTIHSPLSHFKGPNALLYVLAGLEKKEQQQDDMLLLSRQLYVSELVSSNIFWVKNDRFYTPALDTGCVNGIMRRNILRFCASEKIKIDQVNYQVEQLYEADAVFSANVTGIKTISHLQSKEIYNKNKLLDHLTSVLS
ncbi:aminotransferase class IV [Pontibacter silvestris]|uniref:aminotransferase class IV n=1 Tax=Pontibacter silvestris TaxID=2305183 RepID=UPI001E40B646|nr:aminotransferase class IV [Pontibacter silvestris]MCC9135419.1 aminotransferase class IV [Pontibacter silvestris]